MDFSRFSETDLARLALSERLRGLSESFRVAVASDDGPELATRLWSLLAEEIPVLQDAIVAHQRSHGASWTEIAAVSAVDEGAAEDRWSDTVAERVVDPAAVATALDDWYIRHAQLEPLAQVRDPFSRLLSPNAPREHECLICVKYRGGAIPAYGGYPQPPGGHLIDDGRWRVGHGPTAYWPAGTLVIESHRHFLDYAEMDEAETGSIGPLIARLIAPLKEVTGAPRVHVFSCMEGAEHFHVWLVPRTGDVPSGRRFITVRLQPAARRVRRTGQSCPAFQRGGNMSRRSRGMRLPRIPAPVAADTPRYLFLLILRNTGTRCYFGEVRNICFVFRLTRTTRSSDMY